MASNGHERSRRIKHLIPIQHTCYFTPKYSIFPAPGTPVSELFSPGDCSAGMEGASEEEGKRERDRERERERGR